MTSHDIAMIEKALQLAISQAEGEIKASEFREVLHKLHDSSVRVADTQSSPMFVLDHDGYRYDYDDTSDIL